LVTIGKDDVLSIVSIDPMTQVPTVMENVRVSSATGGATPSITLTQRTAQTSANVILVHTATGGRTVGKINLNCAFDSETLSAICDPSASNTFTADDVGTVYSGIDSAIHQGTTTSRPLNTPPSIGTWNNPQADQTFLGTGMVQTQVTTAPFAATDLLQLTTANGVNRSYFRPKTSFGTVPFSCVMEASASGGGTSSNHPWTRFELLNKTFNNLTSRSNVFAVWLTVGFFECDANGNNLGPEIGKPEGKSIRHRMFAIVDRTGLAVPRQVAAIPTGVTIAAGSQVATLNGVAGIVSGTQLLIGNVGSGNVELVTVGTIRGNQFQLLGTAVTPASFAFAHSSGETVYIAPGNWGPQPGFDVTQPVNREIVPYYSIIE
jgi:hypothetical protein